MSAATDRIRLYPMTCRSVYCGRTDCTGCPNLPALEDFKRWREERAAIRPDDVWNPTVWEAAR